MENRHWNFSWLVPIAFSKFDFEKVGAGCVA